MGQTAKSKVSFPRNENGMIDINEGKYEEHPIEMTAKFPTEVRLSLGVGIVSNDGIQIGVKAKPYSYTGKKIVGINAYERLKNIK